MEQRVFQLSGRPLQKNRFVHLVFAPAAECLLKQPDFEVRIPAVAQEPSKIEGHSRYTVAGEVGFTGQNGPDFLGELRAHDFIRVQAQDP